MKFSFFAVKKIAVPAFVLLVLQFVFSAGHSFSVAAPPGKTLTQTEKLASLCKVWGFLKYYHPAVAGGKRDWDKELLDHIAPVEKAPGKEELSRIYISWIRSLGKLKHCRKCEKQIIPDSLKFNLDLSWTDDKEIFTDSLVTMLNEVENNRNTGSNFYVQQPRSIGNTSYKNEKTYPDSTFPGEGCRLLTLFRYWNIIDYFYPYKYVLDENWNDVLDEMIPEFRDSKDVVAYNLVIMKLTAKLNDSHAVFESRFSWRYFGSRWPPFHCDIVEDKAIVTRIYNDSLAKLDDIQPGDIILQAEGKNVTDIISDYSKYISASNHPALLRKMPSYILNGNTSEFTVVFDRNGVVATKTIHRYYNSQIKREQKKTTEEKPWKILGNNIGYVNMGDLTLQQADSAMRDLLETKAIIFDVRNYPQGTMYKIAGYLNKEGQPFAMFTFPDLSYPGVFNFTPRPVQCGPVKANPDYYKGRVILLVNEETQSHAEFTCMALQTAPDVTIIGSQTAGADGNVSQIPLPGGYTTRMTGLGVYYPDKKETQRIGIVPDIEVHPTIEGIRLHKDEVLDRALQFITDGK